MKENLYKSTIDIINEEFISISEDILYILSTRPYHFTNNGKVPSYTMETDYEYLKIEFNSDSVFKVSEEGVHTYLIQAIYKEENNYVIESFHLFSEKNEIKYRKRILDDDYLSFNGIEGENKNAKFIFDKIAEKSSYFETDEEEYLCDDEEFYNIHCGSSSYICEMYNAYDLMEDCFKIDHNIENSVKVLDDVRKEFKAAKEQRKPIYIQNKVMIK